LTLQWWSFFSCGCLTLGYMDYGFYPQKQFFFLIVTSPIRNDQSLEFPKTYSLNCRHQNGFFYYDQWHTKISSVWRRLPQLNNGRKKGVENNCLLFLWESRHSRLWGIPSIFKLLSSLTFFYFCLTIHIIQNISSNMQNYKLCLNFI
jgi:hypothetical protein